MNLTNSPLLRAAGCAVRGTAIAVTRGMRVQQVSAEPYNMGDGLGVRTAEQHPFFGTIEVLEFAPGLAANPAAEADFRVRAARGAVLRCPRVATVRRIERHRGGLRVTAERPAGTRLSDLLSDLEGGRRALSDDAVVRVAAAVVRAVAELHDVPGRLAHGALNPSHVVLTGDGGVVLTDAIFGAALEGLQRDRVDMWREFGLALPSHSGTNWFNQRADVTQLGALVLAIALRRRLLPGEYPGGIADLVVAATPDRIGRHALGLRHWLQQALQLPPRPSFRSATLARRAFADVSAAAVLGPSAGPGESVERLPATRRRFRIGG